MDDQTPGNSIGDGLAFLLAALRQDTTAMAHLLATATPRQLRAIAIFCAVYATHQARTLEQATPGLDTHAVLQTVALHLATT